ncbi:MAG: 5'-3' exonuclease H3TH domain-containing protein [bacterium]|nr:5'-3' exonuclease H3TH domain-containing protein [bacterium]
MKTLVLLDAHALIHRAYHALPKFTSKNTGEPTGALYGLSTMLIKVIRELKPDYLVAAYDLPGPTFRHEAYSAYKATRKEADIELVAQLKRSHDVVAAFGIPDISAPGFEADDILGTIVEQVKNMRLPVGQGKLKIVIVSGDMDVLQLVDGDRVVVYTMRKGLEDIVIYDEKKVEERFGFGPKALIDYKGLRGDASDNIIGVPGVGEKTATDIIKNFGNIENLYTEIEKASFAKASEGKSGLLKERIIKLLLEHKKDAFFSKNLATIRRDAPIKFQMPEANFTLNKEELTKLFIELGFNSLVSRI